MKSLRQSLLDAHLTRLRVIAHFWDVDLTVTRQRDVAIHLVEAMTKPESVAYVWETLLDGQRQALQALLTAGGQMPRHVFARQWGDVRTMGPGRMDREEPWLEPISPAEGLWYRGLVFHAFEQGPNEAYEIVFVPAELRALLPTPDTSPSVIALEPISVTAPVHSAGDAILDDACTLLAYFHNESVRLKPDNEWPNRHQERLQRRLCDGDPERFAFLRHLSRHVGWFREGKSGLLHPAPGPVTAWLQSSSHQQRGVLAAAWRDDSTWNDLFHVPSLHPEDTGAWRNDPVLAREAILDYLKACSPDAWYKFDDFVAAVKETAPDFQRPGGDYTNWYIRDAATGAYLSGFESWDAVEGMLIRYLITRPMAWLGLVELATRTSSEMPIAFRLTTAGSVFLDLEEPPPEAEPPPLDLRSDFSVLIPPGRRYERFQLARVADWAFTGDPFVYRLTPSSLKRAQREGITTARVLEFLEQVADAPMPRSVEAALTRWEARGTEAQLERVILLRLSSEDLMTQVTSSPRIRQLIQEQIGSTAALVRESDWPRLIAALGEMGLLPNVVNLEERGL